jgi:dimethylargininase
MFTHAITRRPGKNFAEGLTPFKHETPNYELIIRQHEVYIETLRSFGLNVIVFDALPDYPDAHFVEDTAVVTPDVAVIANPGAASRRGEEESIAEILARYRKIIHIQAPGTLDGGDVLMVGAHFFIGLSERTNKEGVEQLGCTLEAYGNNWTTIPVVSGLHLKSSVNYVGGNTLLITEDFADFDEFRSYDKIIVDKDEAYACNTLLVNDRLITPRGFPTTRRKLERMGLEIIELDMSEARKMDGGLTCLSVRF